MDKVEAETRDMREQLTRENEERRRENVEFRDKLEADTRQLMEKIEEESNGLRDSMESQGQELFDKIQQVGNCIQYELKRHFLILTLEFSVFCSSQIKAFVVQVSKNIHTVTFCFLILFGFGASILLIGFHEKEKKKN